MKILMILEKIRGNVPAIGVKEKSTESSNVCIQGVPKVRQLERKNPAIEKNPKQ